MYQRSRAKVFSNLNIAGGLCGGGLKREQNKSGFEGWRVHTGLGASIPSGFNFTKSVSFNQNRGELGERSQLVLRFTEGGVGKR